MIGQRDGNRQFFQPDFESTGGNVRNSRTLVDRVIQVFPVDRGLRRRRYDLYGERILLRFVGSSYPIMSRGIPENGQAVPLRRCPALQADMEPAKRDDCNGRHECGQMVQRFHNRLFFRL